MEEILASIRRIIADDDAAKSQPKAPDPVTPPPAQMAPRPAPPPPRAPSPPPRPAAPPPPRAIVPPEPVLRQEDIDAVLAQTEVAPADEPDVLDLTEAMAAPVEHARAAAASGFRTIDGQSDVFFDESPVASDPDVAEAPFAEDTRRPFPELDERPLISSNTSAAIDSAFNTLAHTVLVQNARTLEDLVKEMLRPMLKTWLDDNLPGLVERLVRAEIDRVSRGRG